MMLRNFDLPESLIFYGVDAAIDRTSTPPTPRRGVVRLIEECHEVGTAAILLSESLTTEETRAKLNEAGLGRYASSNEGGAPLLHIRSALESYSLPPSIVDTHNLYDMGALGRSPSPAVLLDSIHTLLIEPRGFGGSSGFGTKAADPTRPPLPKHCVVIVSGTSPTSRDRCDAARMAGMRVVYVEDGGLGTCDAEELVDAVVETLGGDEDWEVITLDGISTPGDFWLNPPPGPRDAGGNKVDVDTMVRMWANERTTSEAGGNLGDGRELKGDTGAPVMAVEDKSDELEADEMARILADLDSL